MQTHLNQKSSFKVLAALGVVYGDIGTSPLYAFKEAFSPLHGLAVTEANVYAILSMIFWSIMIVVFLQYVLITLRFDYKGEGGVLALLSFCAQQVRNKPTLLCLTTVFGAFAVSLFYGDAVITPAISVLSAIEGIGEVAPFLNKFVLPGAIAIILGLFLIQSKGTATVGAWFGPVMLIWFITIGALGLASIVKSPQVLNALNPYYAWNFLKHKPQLALIAGSAVFLCVTGAEALYADMGHFGRKPVQVAWIFFVFPSLILNYFGQGALVLRNPDLSRNPFYLLAPQEMLIPFVLLATLATVIASQATISGAFSATQQASRLSFLPRLRVLHTSDLERGQIYIPLVNWLLLILVLALVLGFKTSTALASAYGIAVAGNLFLSCLMMIIALPFAGENRVCLLWWPFWGFLLLSSGFLAANVTKIGHGGWFPLLLAAVVFTFLTTWRKGSEVLRAYKEGQPVELDPFALDLSSVHKVSGSAIFFASSRSGCPSAFLHNLRHNKVVHEKTLFLMIEFEDSPRVKDDERIEVMRGQNGLMRVNVHLGYRERADIKLVIDLLHRKGVEFDLEQTSFFISKPALVSVSQRGLFGWRRSLFSWMQRNSTSVAEYFNLPVNRVVELGSQIAV